MNDVYTLRDSDAIHAFDWNVLERAVTGYAVADGADVTINTGTLGSGNNTLDVASGSVLVNRTEHGITTQSVDIDAGGSNPRWDIVAVDSNGNVVVYKGDEEEALIAGQSTDESHRTVERPAPQDLSNEDATPLALVWVDASASSIDIDDLFDVKPPANLYVAAVEMIRDLTMNGNDIVNPGQIDGVDVSAHATDSAAHHAKATSGDITHDDTVGGTAGNPHADSASDTDLSNHASNADAHHNQSHGNADHTSVFVSDGDGTTREIWVIASGASDPAGAGADDIIFEEES